MKSKFYYKRPKKEDSDEDKAFVQMRVLVPRSMERFIQKRKEDTGIPIARLLAFAIDNEITESVTPFNYPCEMPKSPYVEYAYAEEAGKLLRFIQRYERKPMTLEQLMLCRRDAGVPSRETFMLAFRELLEKGMIEEYTARDDHEPGAKRFRPVLETHEEIETKHYRKRPEEIGRDDDE